RRHTRSKRDWSSDVCSSDLRISKCSQMKSRIWVWNQLRALADAGTGIIVATQMMSEADQCDTAALLMDGKIFAQGKPKKLMDERSEERREDKEKAYRQLNDR